MPQSIGQHPSEHEINQALSSIQGNSGFARSRRLSALLDYLVNESLAGRGDKIKATSIAIDFYGRDESFDQQSDPIVRVEAGRLRQRLADYYHGPGQNDSVVIEIPKGGYRPEFTHKNGHFIKEVGEPLAKPSSPIQSYSIPLNWGVIGALLIMVLILAYNLYSEGPSQDGNHSEAFVPVPANKPYIVVTPVAATTSNEQSIRLAKGLVEALITNLSKLSGLSVMAHGSVLEAQQRGYPFSIKELRSKFGVTHLLRGTVEQKNGRLVLYVQLVDTKTAQVIWAERIVRSLDKILDLEEEIALAITTELAVQIQPDEQARLSQYHASSAEAWLLYRQGLITIMPPKDTARVQAARQLFKRAVEVDPSFAGGYVGQSFSHSTQALFMNSPHPEMELARAIELAEQAVALDKDFGGSYAMLAFAHVLAGDIEHGVSNAKKSVAIQPGDAFSQFIMGMSMVIAKQPEQSISHLREALRLDPMESRMPYLNVLGIAYYAMGDYSNALATIEKNYERGGPRGPHMDVFIAASHAQLGEEEQARQIIIQMQERYPDFPYRAWIERWLTGQAQRQKTTDILRGLGLKTASSKKLGSDKA